MPTDTIALDSGNNCDIVDGGLTHSYYVDREYIDSVTATGNVISAITMGAASKWERLDYDRDNTAYYNQTGSRNGKRIAYDQECFLKFAGLDEVFADASDTVKGICDLVFIHVMTNGKRIVQGIELDAAATGGFDVTKLQSTRLTPSLLSDTSDNESRTEWTIAGQAKVSSPYTTLTDTAIEAL